MLLFLAMSGSVTMMEQSGLNQDLGLQYENPSQEIKEDLNMTQSDIEKSGAEETEAEGGFGDTLFQLFISAARTFLGFTDLVFGVPAFLTQNGIPSWIVWPLFIPMALITTLKIIQMATGRRAY